LGKKKKIQWHSNSNDHCTAWVTIKPDNESYDGLALSEYLIQHHSLSFDEFVDYEYFRNSLFTKLGNFKGTSIETDGGMITRGNSPFLNDPNPPSFVLRENLSTSLDLMSKIQLIQASLTTFRKNPREKFKLSQTESTALKIIMTPYVKTMSNLIGGVHNSTTDTMLTLVNLLNFDPSKTVLLECGSGAPIFGLEASIFTKRTICLDLPSVMKTVYWILSFMSPDDKLFAQTINLISGLLAF